MVIAVALLVFLDSIPVTEILLLLGRQQFARGSLEPGPFLPVDEPQILHGMEDLMGDLGAGLVAGSLGDPHGVRRLAPFRCNVGLVRCADLDPNPDVLLALRHEVYGAVVIDYDGNLFIPKGHAGFLCKLFRALEFCCALCLGPLHLGARSREPGGLAVLCKEPVSLALVRLGLFRILNAAFLGFLETLRLDFFFRFDRVASLRLLKLTVTRFECLLPAVGAFFHGSRFNSSTETRLCRPVGGVQLQILCLLLLLPDADSCLRLFRNQQCTALRPGKGLHDPRRKRDLRAAVLKFLE